MAESKPVVTPEQVSAMMDITSMLAEMTTGYFKKLTAGGIPDDVAAEMTTKFHDMCMAQITQDAAKSSVRGVRRN